MLAQFIPECFFQTFGKSGPVLMQKLCHHPVRMRQAYHFFN